jgi:hypothetical protein
MTWISRSPKSTPAAAAMPSSRGAHDLRSILCGEEEDAAGVRHREVAQAGDATRHGDSQIERQERLAALGLAADDADGVLRP